MIEFFVGFDYVQFVVCVFFDGGLVFFEVFYFGGQCVVVLLQIFIVLFLVGDLGFEYYYFI